MTLTQHIAALNAETQAWVDKDPENRWGGMFVEDQAHWAGRGITTVEQFEYTMACSAYSDTYKEINGFRPRHDLSGYTADEINDMVAKMFDDRDAEEAVEQVAQQEARDPTPLTHNPFATLKL